jgi:general secretion pathway protein J
VKRSSGFTLLEILVVISLMGLMLGLVGTAVVAANRSVIAAERTSTRLDEIRATQRYLRQSISQMLPLSAAGNDHVGANSVRGTPDALGFYAPLPNSLGGGLYHQDLRLNHRHLEVRLAKLDGQQLQSWGEPQRLLSGVTEVRFSYQGRSPMGKRTEWLESWPWPDRLPHAVRIDMHLEGPQAWVQQQVNLRLDLSGEVSSP